jgi:hypothetical protein
MLMKRHITSAKKFVLLRLGKSNDVVFKRMMGFPQNQMILKEDRTLRGSSAPAAHDFRGRRERSKAHEI